MRYLKSSKFERFVDDISLNSLKWRERVFAFKHELKIWSGCFRKDQIPRIYIYYAPSSLMAWGFIQKIFSIVKRDLKTQAQLNVETQYHLIYIYCSWCWWFLPCQALGASFSDAKERKFLEFSKSRPLRNLIQCYQAPNCLLSLFTNSVAMNFSRRKSNLKYHVGINYKCLCKHLNGLDNIHLSLTKLIIIIYPPGFYINANTIKTFVISYIKHLYMTIFCCNFY